MTEPDDRAQDADPAAAERQRMASIRSAGQSWQQWGPYLAERQWGTVREDYSADGEPWDYFTHEDAVSRAYRWGEDGIAGISDIEQRLCLAVALWNGRDSILKERLFGLTNREGNHGEDVKELYYYEDATPSHSYLRMTYRYPQAEFPYAALRAGNAQRGYQDAEYELADTGVLDGDAFFDITAEYAQLTPGDFVLRLTLTNHGAERARLWVLPQLWFRNTWSWDHTTARPRLHGLGRGVVRADHPTLGSYWLHAGGEPQFLFTENETNVPRLYGAAARGPFKDAFHDYLVRGDHRAVAAVQAGTKCAAVYPLELEAGATSTLLLRLSPALQDAPLVGAGELVDQRRREADAWYAALQSGIDDADARLVQRQAFAGLIWSKQFYCYDVRRWLAGDPAQPPPPAGRKAGRNSDWDHLVNADIISMPDKWEYPWYAAWDLAFHTLPFALIDPVFAKRQLVLLGREWYMHPNGQMPAYEWNFGDVNPPVHAWAAWRVFQIDRKQHGGHGDLAFLERVFHKLLLNFTWWVNRKDAEGRNVFQGGFLGLDNIGVFDRSKPLPTGGHIDQSDGTSWMAMYSLNLMRIALELAVHNPVYQDIATKFLEHFLHIADAMTHIGADGGVGLWDEEDEFYYDVLRLPDGRHERLRVRSLVGLTPLFAVETLEPELLARVPNFARRLEWFLDHRPDLAALVSHWEVPGKGQRRLLSLLRGHRMKCLLRRMLDETEFLSDYGVRGLSRVHASEPYVFRLDGAAFTVAYQPGESDSGMFGGNSNWRGPVWMPVNYLLIESLQKFHHYYGDDFRVECPTGSGHYLTIEGVADELAHRLTRIFLKDAAGRRAVFGDDERLQRDPRFRDRVLFYEYFHGDTGRGLGASHQTGWTALVAKLLQPRRFEH
jgi:hypothetical protein